MTSTQLITGASPSLPILILAATFILFVIEVFALYLHLAGFTAIEVILLIALPSFIYLTALPMVTSALLSVSGNTASAVSDIAKYVDVPLFSFGKATIGVNLVGFSIPVIISVKLLLQKRIPLKETSLLVLIVSVIAYLFTRFEPGTGMVIYMSAIPAILAAAISFMLKKMKGASNFNPALLSYAGATMGILFGVDILNLHRAITYPWDEAVFISIGGSSVLDAIFVAGIVALLADLVFRSQEENVIGNLIKRLTGDRHK
ncbi:MAG: DUF1614 domain-containing protein [Chloroflexi bacterium]|nr:DUF1614 domain-containing protein [Chloroflexota bacterium]